MYIQATIVIIYQLFALINIFWQQWNTFLVVSKVFFNFLKDLKSDGHGNGGTLINGNGGTHYHLSIQEIIIHHISVVYIN